MTFKEFLHEHIAHGMPIFFDGAMGTMIHASQNENGKENLRFAIPEELNFSEPDLIEGIHRAYLQAGCNILTTNTFGANPIKLHNCSFCSTDVINQAIFLAKKACNAINRSQKTFIALDMGSCGKLMQPMGELSFDDAYRAFKTCVLAAEKAGADLAIIETISDLYEMKAAILAVKENTALPIIASATFQPNLRTLTGTDVKTLVTCLEGLGVTALGFNCGGGLVEAQNLTAEFLECASVPVIVQPNAGIPIIEKGQTVFKLSAKEFAQAQYNHFVAGASILGGCCGTTPAHLFELISVIQKNTASDFDKNRSERIKNLSARQKENAQKTLLCSYAETIEIGNPKNGAILIGERINPTGKKRLKQALTENDFAYILEEAKKQIDQGTHVLDVNAGIPNIDEKAVMISLVKSLQATYTVPLQLDSSEPAVLEGAMRYYNGKPLVNSVNGKQDVMQAVFPLLKKYGGVVVALTLDEGGIPETADGRLAIAKKIVQKAHEYDISPANIIFDPLTLTISSQQKEARETLSALRCIKSDVGCKTILGISNISFGLPERDILNAHFFNLALFSGLDAGIINPLSRDLMSAFCAYRAICGFDVHCLEYIEKITKFAPLHVNRISAPNLNAEKPVAAVDTFDEIIICGLKDSAVAATEKLLQTKMPTQIIDDHIIPALDVVGKDFETGKKFLPQLLLSSDTVSVIFEVLKAALAQAGIVAENKGSIILATVYGDIHDIGKNITKALLESYGFKVYDLGKNVPVETIVKAVETEKIYLVGLSALMTTTVGNMEKTITALRELEKKIGKQIKIIAGGAVLTEEYAKKIGADLFGKDAMTTIRIAKAYYNKDGGA